MKTILIYDTGLFCHIAEHLAASKYFDKVLYHNPTWKDSFASSNKVYVADGIPGIERAEHFWDAVNEYRDKGLVVMFPDIQNGDLQDELVRQGIPVWGSRGAEELEMDRWAFKQDTLTGLGMPVQPMKRIIGLDKLREYLKDDKNAPKYIKISMTRGDMESRKHSSYAISKQWMDELEHKHGPLCSDMEFIAEDPIETTLELGYDGFCIDGRYPDPSMHGVEMKDVGYIGCVMPYAQLPEPMLYVNNKMSATLKGFGYRGFMSTEIRVGKDGKFYYIDPTMRAGSPPSQVMMEMFSNWPDIIWNGAQGRIVKPIAVAKYGIQAFIYGERCDKEWMAYKYPKSLEKWFKFSFSCIVDGVRYTIPQTVGMTAMGSVVAIDNDPMKAIKKLVEYASQLEGDGLDVRLDAIPKAVKEIHEAQKQGFMFGSARIPSIEEVAKVVV